MLALKYLAFLILLSGQLFCLLPKIVYSGEVSHRVIQFTALMRSHPCNPYKEGECLNSSSSALQMSSILQRFACNRYFDFCNMGAMWINNKGECWKFHVSFLPVGVVSLQPSGVVGGDVSTGFSTKGARLRPAKSKCGCGGLINVRIGTGPLLDVGNPAPQRLII